MRTWDNHNRGKATKTSFRRTSVIIILFSLKPSCTFKTSHSTSPLPLSASVFFTIPALHHNRNLTLLKCKAQRREAAGLAAPHAAFMHSESRRRYCTVIRNCALAWCASSLITAHPLTAYCSLCFLLYMSNLWDAESNSPGHSGVPENPRRQGLLAC